MHKINITFSPSAGGCLKQCFKINNIKEDILALADQLNIGPLDKPWSKERKDYLIELYKSYYPEDLEIEVDDWANEIKKFWSNLEQYDEITVWWSSRSALDFCALMMIVKFNNDIRIKHIDLNQFKSFENIISVGELSPDSLSEFISKEQILSDDEKQNFITKWEEFLKDKNKLVIMTENGPQKSDWNIVDNCILKNIEEKEKVAARLIGECLGEMSEKYNNISDSVIWYRIRKLIEMGDIKYNSDKDFSYKSLIKIVK